MRHIIIVLYSLGVFLSLAHLSWAQQCKQQGGRKRCDKAKVVTMLQPNMTPSRLRPRSFSCVIQNCAPWLEDGLPN